MESIYSSLQTEVFSYSFNWPTGSRSLSNMIYGLQVIGIFLLDYFLKELLPFHLKYVIKNVVCATPPTFKWEFLKTLLRLYHMKIEDLHIITAIWLDNFWISNWPSSLRIFHKKELEEGKNILIFFVSNNL